MGSVVNRINVMAKYASKGLTRKNRLSRKLDGIFFGARLTLSNLLYWLVQTWLRIFKNKNFEEYVEDSIKQ
jgi:hypothetical protein